MTASQNEMEENQGVKANDAEVVMVPVEVGQGGKIPLSVPRVGPVGVGNRCSPFGV